MPRVLLLGAGGQLGMQLARQLTRKLGGSSDGAVELTALTRTELDFTDADALRAAVRHAVPEIVINAAAYTAVDKAEQERELARLVNAVAPGVIAAELARTKGWLIHYSTDYVFDGSGTKPWIESDPTGPLSVYGQTKLDGELAIAATGCRHVVLRTSWVYAAEGRNFLHTMLRLGREREQLKIVDDQIGAPTSAEAITEATSVVLQRLVGSPGDVEASGVYHLTCAGQTSWCGFAQAIFAAFAANQKAPEVLPIPTEAYPTPARRPLNSRLNCDKFVRQFGYRMPKWETALNEVAATMLSNAEAT
jgi:dTDP-4-dehydrorhamnose reductase